jgi:hypothetical protein
MNKRLFLSLPCWIFVGATISMLAGQAHPNGPEKRPFAERTIRVQGKTQDCTLTLAYPKPDDMVDWTTGDIYDVAKPHATTLLIHFDYKGFFWQGVFGGVTLEIKIDARKSDSPPWRDLASLLERVRIKTKERNERAKKSNDLDVKLHPNSRHDQEWMEPALSQLNGIPCVQQFVRGNKAKVAKDECYYYFPFDEDHALVLGVVLVDNSDRPGLTQSNWYPRAEGFANQLLSRVRVHVESRAIQK